MILLFGILAASLCALFAETYLLKKRVRSIPIRIHVNGTRGKSTVTRYIAAGLRAGGVSVAEKITGIIPTYISPGQIHHIVRRRGIPRVQEQVSIIRRAAADRAQALVIECMSLQPEYQRMEARIISPTLSIITNIRNDHREIMGDSAEARTASLCECVLPGSTVVTAERNTLHILQELVTSKQGSVHSADPVEGEFPTYVHKENIDIAVNACILAGIDRDIALKGIQRSIENKNESLLHGTTDGKKFIFFNGFAANDVESTGNRFASLHHEYAGYETVIILNTRKDRPVRTKDFVDWISGSDNIARVIVSGTHADAAVRWLSKRPGRCRIVRWNSNAFAAFAQSISPFLADRTLLVGAGNIAGEGFRWVESFNRLTS